MDLPTSPPLYHYSWRTLGTKYNFHPLSFGQLFSSRLYNWSAFRPQHVPSQFRSAVSLDSVWFISICIISSALCISFRHRRFSLVTAVCHLSFTCLLSEFDLIPLVYFKRQISYPHGALFHCDFEALVYSIWIFLIVIFILYWEIKHLIYDLKKKNWASGQKYTQGCLCSEDVFFSQCFFLQLSNHRFLIGSQHEVVDWNPGLHQTLLLDNCVSGGMSVCQFPLVSSYISLFFFLLKICLNTAYSSCTLNYRIQWSCIQLCDNAKLLKWEVNFYICTQYICFLWTNLRDYFCSPYSYLANKFLLKILFGMGAVLICRSFVIMRFYLYF